MSVLPPAGAARARPAPQQARLWLLAGVMAVGAVLLGVVVLPGGPVPALGDQFARAQLVGWVVLAGVTGGITFGDRAPRARVLAAGLVGSAALLGAGPLECALVALAGALGGLRASRGDVAG